jgi:hypothetical protein
MLAVFLDLGLDGYINGMEKLPESANPVDVPSKELIASQAEWDRKDAKACCQIELALSNVEMIHVIGAVTAQQMWEQLCTVKESKGQLGVLAAQRTLFRATAKEGSDMVEHIARLRQLQAELHIMGSIVSDKDFVMILLTSLLELWENYASSFLGSHGNQPTLKSQELVGVLIEEDRHRKECTGGTTLQAR